MALVPPTSRNVQPQAAIADLNLGALVTLADVITALGVVQTKLNTLLTELRAAGIIAP